jgi:2-isopropylmalate synthase
MARRIEIFDTTLRDGNKLPFAVLSTADRVLLSHQLALLGVDAIEAGFPAAGSEESDCVCQICAEVRGPYVAALARALDGDIERALECLSKAAKPYLHIFMSVSPQFLSQVLKERESRALENVSRCIRTARGAKVRVQFSLSEAPHGRREFLKEVCVAAREAGADVINLADTNGVLVPEEMAGLVKEVEGFFAASSAPLIGVHCHDDLGLATANSLAAIRAGAGHVEVTVGGFGERAGNAALEEVAFLISAFGERYGISHGIRLHEVARTSGLFDSLTGIRTHPNKSVIGQCAFTPAPGGFSGTAVEPKLRELMRQQSIGPRYEPIDQPEQEGPYSLESFNVLTSSHSPPVGVVVLKRDGRTLTQTSHGNGPIDALFGAVDKALGFSTRMVLYSVSTLAVGTEALAEVIVTAELRGRRFHGRHRSTDVIEASLRAYIRACNEIGRSGILEGPGEFHVAGEYLWE